MIKIARLVFVFVIFSAYPLSAQDEPAPLYLDTPSIIIERSGAVYDLAYSPDGSLLAAGLEGEISLWDTASGELTYVFKTEGFVDRLRFVPEGDLLLALVKAEPNYLLVVNAVDGTIIRTLSYGRAIRDFDIAPDGDNLALILERQSASGLNQTVALARLQETLQSGVVGFRELAGDVTGEWGSVDFDPTGAFLAAGVWFSTGNINPDDMNYEQGNASVWSLADGRETAYTTTGVLPLTQVLFSPDGTRLFAGSSQLIAWDMATGDAAQESGSQFDFGIAIGGDFIVSARMDFDNQDGIDNMRTPLVLRDWRSGETLALMRRAYDIQPTGGGGGMFDMNRIPVAIRADGSQVASFDPNGVISLWDTVDLLPE